VDDRTRIAWQIITNPHIYIYMDAVASGKGRMRESALNSARDSGLEVIGF
jgi:hypothetical protein